MTSISFQDGKVVMRDEKVGTEQDCCCDGGACPSGCPSLEGCNLVVVLNYPGFPFEQINESAISYMRNGYVSCELEFSIADIPIESGGDISGIVTVGYDDECNPTVSELLIGRTVDDPDNERSCDDGDTNCVEVLVSIVCNPLP